MNQSASAPTLLPLAAGAALRIIVEPGEAPPPSPAIEARWNELKQAIPRLYNGPILSVIDIDAGAGIIRSRRDTYQRLIVQDPSPGSGALDTGVRQLSITGILTVGSGRDMQVLLGQRSSETRMYPGMWELGPAGGLEPPPGTEAAQLDHAATVAQLAREAREEIGLDLASAAETARPLAIVFDPLANSYDIAVHIDLPHAFAPVAANWEYRHIRWIPAAELAAAATDESIIPPTRALLHWLATR